MKKNYLLKAILLGTCLPLLIATLSIAGLPFEFVSPLIITAPLYFILRETITAASRLKKYILLLVYLIIHQQSFVFGTLFSIRDFALSTSLVGSFVGMFLAALALAAIVADEMRAQQREKAH